MTSSFADFQQPKYLQEKFERDSEVELFKIRRPPSSPLPPPPPQLWWSNKSSVGTLANFVSDLHYFSLHRRVWCDTVCECMMLLWLNTQCCTWMHDVTLCLNTGCFIIHEFTVSHCGLMHGVSDWQMILTCLSVKVGDLIEEYLVQERDIEQVMNAARNGRYVLICVFFLLLLLLLIIISFFLCMVSKLKKLKPNTA